MELLQARSQFINNWGVFASQWGINKTMAQVHALLLVSATALHAEEIMHELKISRGNANMNLRELIDWGLVRKQVVAGERKEYFIAEKEMWTVITQIIKERKKRELEPMLKLLKQLQNVRGIKKNENHVAFVTTIGNIIKFSEQADKTLEKFIKAEESWLWNSFIKIIK